MSRLTIDVTDQQHQALKLRAALEGKSIKQYALERLFPSGEDHAVQELRQLLMDRLVRAERGEITGSNAEDIAEEVIREDGAA